MAIRKSIFQVELRDDGFNAFLKKYNAYQASLKSMPAAWAAVNQKIQGSRSSFDKLVDGMVAANVQSKLQAVAQERADKITRTMAEKWQGIARSTKNVAANIAGATIQLLKWASITGLVSGLLGAGGLFGIDRLAFGVAAGRRSSLGLGTGIGEQRAFGANFGRLVDPDSFLSAVAESKLDVTKRVGLIGAGLTPGQINGSTASTSVALLQQLKRIADSNDPALYAQVISSRRLDQFVSPQDLQRLRNTSPAEIARLTAAYGRNKGEFDLPADVATKWQEFVTQMSRAGQSVENTLVRGLAPLAGPLTHLSEGFEKVARAFLAEGGPLEKWIKVAGDGLERFAGYIGTPEFSKNVGDFVKGVGELASTAVRAARFLGIISGPALDPNAVLPTQLGSRGDAPKTVGAAKFNGWMNYFNSKMSGGNHNPGNIRFPGQTTGFATFPTDEAGVAAMARQIQLYSRRDHLDTIDAIVGKYAPPSENDTKAYVGDVSRKTGFASGQHLDLSDPTTMSRMIAAMVSHEQSKGHYDSFKDARVVVQVLNNTGGNAAVSVNQLKN